MFLRFIHLQYISVFHFFLWLNNILFYGYTTFCISIHMLMGICIVSTFWLLGICWCEHWCASFVWTPVFSSFGYIPRSRIAILIIFKRQLKQRNTYSILLSSIRKVWVFTLSIWVSAQRQLPRPSCTLVYPYLLPVSPEEWGSGEDGLYSVITVSCERCTMSGTVQKEVLSKWMSEHFAMGDWLPFRETSTCTLLGRL